MNTDDSNYSPNAVVLEGGVADDRSDLAEMGKGNTPLQTGPCAPNPPFLPRLDLCSPEPLDLHSVASV